MTSILKAITALLIVGIAVVIIIGTMPLPSQEDTPLSQREDYSQQEFFPPKEVVEWVEEENAKRQEASQSSPQEEVEAQVASITSLKPFQEKLPDLQVIAQCDNPMKILPTLMRTCEYEIRNNSEREIVYEHELKVCFRPIGEYFERCSIRISQEDILTYTMVSKEGVRNDLQLKEKFQLESGESVNVQLRLFISSSNEAVKRVERHMGAGASASSIEGDFTFLVKETRPTTRSTTYTPAPELVLTQYKSNLDAEECKDTHLRVIDRSRTCLFFVSNNGDKEKRYQFKLEICYAALGGEWHCTERIQGQILLGINPHVSKDEKGDPEIDVTSQREVKNKVQLLLSPGEKHSFRVHLTDLHESESFKRAEKNLSSGLLGESSQYTTAMKGEIRISLIPR